MTRHIIIPALVVAAVGTIVFLLSWALIIAAQGFPIEAAPLPYGVEFSPPTTACAATEAPIMWHGRLACVTPDGVRYPS